MSLPKGFKHLPVTAGLTSSLIVVPLAISILDWKPYFMFAWDPFITKWNQFWRLIILQFQFQNQSEVTLAVVITILKLKGLERVFGSLKLFKIILLLLFYNFIAITILSFGLYKTIGWDLFIPSGPFGMIFGLYYPYMKYTPDVYLAEFDLNSIGNYRSLDEDIKVSITDKFSTHIFYLLLFFNEGIPSMIVSLLGYFIGYLYFNNLVPLIDTSMGYIDPLFYKLTHEKEYETTTGRISDNLSSSNHTNDIPTNESQALDLADDDGNITSRDDTPVRTFGQQMLDTFRR